MRHESLVCYPILFWTHNTGLTRPGASLAPFNLGSGLLFLNHLAPNLFLRERMIGLGPFLSGPSFFEILAPTLGLTRIFHVWELKVHLHNTTKFHLIIYNQFYSYIIYNYLYFNFILGCMFLNFPKPVGQNFKN